MASDRARLTGRRPAEPAMEQYATGGSSYGPDLFLIESGASTKPEDAAAPAKGGADLVEVDRGMSHRARGPCRRESTTYSSLR